MIEPGGKPILWMYGEIKTPPFTKEARIQAGFLLRMLQEGESLRMPWSRPMHSIGPRCHELRIDDKGKTWRIIYRVDVDAVVIGEVFEKRPHKRQSTSLRFVVEDTVITMPRDMRDDYDD